MPSLTGPTLRKISIVAALRHLTHLATQNAAAASRIALPWLALAALFNAWALWSHPNEPTTLSNINFGPYDYLANAVSILATSSIAVSWHRHVILNDDMKLVQAFHIDKKVLVYAASNLLITLCIGVPVLLAIVLVNAIVPALIVPLATAFLLLSVMFIIRLSLRPVAIAVGNLPFKFQSAFEATRGNNLGILAIAVTVAIVCMIALLVAGLLNQGLAQLNPKLDLPGRILLSIPADFFSFVVVNAMFSTLYRFFVENKDL